MRLTVRGCATVWQSTRTKKPDPWEGRHSCVGCDVGRANAGLPPVTTSAGRAAWSNVCARCWNISDRLIGGKHCPSCYNRQREAIIGRNAKGVPPRLMAMLHSQHMTLVADGKMRRVRQDHVVNLAEAAVLASRAAADAGACIMLGAPRLFWPGTRPQMELPL